MGSTPIIFTPHPALYRVASDPAPKPEPKPEPPVAPYQRLKELDTLLDREETYLAEAQQTYQQTLQEFAGRCRELWQQEKSQGSRKGRGFRSRLQEAGIKVGRAYRAMKKFFPADFSKKTSTGAQPPSAADSSGCRVSTSSAANEVGLRFTGKLHEGKEVLQCVFALTAEEKAELAKCLDVVDAAQVQRLLLEAVKQAALQAHVAPAPGSRHTLGLRVVGWRCRGP